MKPAFVQVPQLVLSDALDAAHADLEGDVKVFNLTIDNIEQKIDELMPPVAALGYNGQWPGPTIRVTEGDKVRAIFTNNLNETTGVHFHGVEFDDFFQDGVPFVTQQPIIPGETFTYEFMAEQRRARSCTTRTTTPPTRSAVGCSGRSSSTRSPNRSKVRPRVHLDLATTRSAASRSTATASRPSSRSLAAQGETVRIRFMNEGDHDAPVAPPRDADAGRRPGRLAARRRRVHVRHPGRQPG